MFGSTFRIRLLATTAFVLTSGVVAACGQQPAITQQPAANPAASKPSGAELKIATPAANQSVGTGAVKISVTYNGPTLVPGAEAKKLDDYHLHYFLDEDATPFLSGGKSIPAGNPRIVHSAAREVTFENLSAGKHTVTVVMSGNNHVAVTPVLTDSVAFTVE
jgi:hypothetical protein